MPVAAGRRASYKQVFIVRSAAAGLVGFIDRYALFAAYRIKPGLVKPPQAPEATIFASHYAKEAQLVYFGSSMRYTN
jgi:hypothetical protein